MHSDAVRKASLDMADSIDQIAELTCGIGLSDHLADRKTRSAVERELLILSDASVSVRFFHVM